MMLKIGLTAILVVTSLSTNAARGKDVSPSIRNIVGACSIPAVLDARTNVWEDHILYPTSDYRNEVEQAVKAIDDAQLREKAAKVANVGTFMWM